jgi:hypothetical protein
LTITNLQQHFGFQYFFYQHLGTIRSYALIFNFLGVSILSNSAQVIAWITAISALSLPSLGIGWAFTRLMGLMLRNAGKILGYKKNESSI